jgi:hypothetical protein
MRSFNRFSCKNKSKGKSQKSKVKSQKAKGKKQKQKPNAQQWINNKYANYQSLLLAQANG